MSDLENFTLGLRHAAEASAGKDTLNLLANDKLQTLSVISGLSIFPWRF